MGLAEGLTGSQREAATMTARLLALLLLASTAAGAQPPPEFMQLYHDFTGGGKTAIGQQLADALERKEQMGAAGPLVLVVESGIYAYDAQTRRLIAHTSLRSDDPQSGFYELTAVSHIGPALAYLAKLKELNAPGWRDDLARLLRDIRAVRTVNASGAWIDRSTSPVLKLYRERVVKLIDYGCARAADYIQSVLDGRSFTSEDVSRDFFDGVTPAHPIPFKNVMVGTFALVALSDYQRAYQAFSGSGLDWAKAKVLFQFHAGTNFGGGLSRDTNHLYQFLRLASRRQLPEERIFFTPYAAQKASVGQAVMPAEDFDYYTMFVWYHQYARPKVAVSGAFSQVSTIYVPSRPALPGDRDYSEAGAIDDFMMRMKYSLGDNTQLLSNALGFWMSGELDRQGWDPARVQIPGFTAGFPAGVSGYP